MPGELTDRPHPEDGWRSYGAFVKPSDTRGDWAVIEEAQAYVAEHHLEVWRGLIRVVPVGTKGYRRCLFVARPKRPGQMIGNGLPAPVMPS